MSEKSEELQRELLRRGSNRARMLLAFKREGELNTQELLRFGPGLSSRLHELREDGHRIVTVYEKPGLYRYIYLGMIEDDGTNVSVVD
jgi:hypothetical protein